MLHNVDDGAGRCSGVCGRSVVPAAAECRAACLLLPTDTSHVPGAVRLGVRWLSSAASTLESVYFICRREKEKTSSVLISAFLLIFFFFFFAIVIIVNQ